MKAGLKVALGTLVKQCWQILTPYHLLLKDKEKASLVREFQEYFSSPTHYAQCFADAEYQLKEKRQRENRKPQALPNEKHLAHLYSHIHDRVTSICEKGIRGKKDFVTLRKLVEAQLTLYNCRRSNEVARFKLADWEE